jgi:hypothetical protein
MLSIVENLIFDLATKIDKAIISTIHVAARIK